MNSETQNSVLTEQWQQLALGAAIVTRMYPNYALFAELMALDGATTFRNILNLVWEFVGGKNQSIDFAKQLEKLELITPNPADYDSYGVYPGLDATVALACLLGACLRFDQSEVDSLVLLSSSTIGHYLEATEQPQENNHPLYVADREFIRQVVERIGSVSSAGRSELVNVLRADLAELDESNIGVEWPKLSS